MNPIGVGILGAGLATQAIHLPVLATMRHRFQVRLVSDIDQALAEAVADRCGARATTSSDEIFGDPAVEVVVLCTPSQLHAEQVLQACDSGKSVVLCEKPLATDRVGAEAVAARCAATGTQLVVGTMHAHDPAVRSGIDAWCTVEDAPTVVRSTIMFPTNDLYIGEATETVVPLGEKVRPEIPSVTDASTAARLIRFGLLGLACHDIPLIRRFHPRPGRLTRAAHLPRFGYSLLAADGDRLLAMDAMSGASWPATWSLTVVGASHRLHIDFPPSYVLAGSARVELESAGASRLFHEPTSGYEAEWLTVHRLAVGEAPGSHASDAAEDLAFALDLADAADELLGLGT